MKMKKFINNPENLTPDRYVSFSYCCNISIRSICYY